MIKWTLPRPLLHFLFPPISPCRSLPVSSHPLFLPSVDFTVSGRDPLPGAQSLGFTVLLRHQAFYTTRPFPSPSRRAWIQAYSSSDIRPLWSSLHPSLCLLAEDTEKTSTWGCVDTKQPAADFTQGIPASTHIHTWVYPQTHTHRGNSP